ncbi:hypothetical protein FDP41_003682 [Naegleria fowleri]|uniref:Uncharacterized protein n=1 Tax=Naegleria fowleri TaxID=5763 RepID=A0A6A5BVS0_NAEFO|nr:uncharacterized protein FDP41_004658 [Naegleria fowleri]XP_044561742.1 uncharacterized protein FDP41_003682 [Naegleria fowleri]KAF0976352.1 hypothetical protein FDP41_004658 [Naegleria fowleri]KAF0977029.1 hypothetical protein FDP41_003682 [Naegleria fowleri]CAG4715866.1 unnamed protein product [Naegleria fowleri]
MKKSFDSSFPSETITISSTISSPSNSKTIHSANRNNNKNEKTSFSSSDEISEQTESQSYHLPTTTTTQSYHRPPPRRKTFEKAKAILSSQMKIPKAFATHKKTLLEASGSSSSILTSVHHQSLMKIGRMYNNENEFKNYDSKGFKDSSQVLQEGSKRGRGVKSIEEIELEQGDSDTSFYTSDEEESPSEYEEERSLKPLSKSRRMKK